MRTLNKDFKDRPKDEFRDNGGALTWFGVLSVLWMLVLFVGIYYGK